MKSKEYIENKLKELENGKDDELLWQYIGTKNIEIYTLKDILKD